VSIKEAERVCLLFLSNEADSEPDIPRSAWQCAKVFFDQKPAYLSGKCLFGLRFANPTLYIRASGFLSRNLVKVTLGRRGNYGEDEPVPNLGLTARFVD